MNTDQKIIKHKVELLNLAEMLGRVSEACQVMGYSRDGFSRFKQLYEKGGELALKEISRHQPVVKNRVAPEIEQTVVEIAIENPALRQVRGANELTKWGHACPPGVRSIWMRHDRQTFARRLKTLEARWAQNSGMVLTEQQVQAREKAKQDKELAGRSKPLTRATWARRTLIMSARSRAWAASTARPSSIPTPKWPL